MSWKQWASHYTLTLKTGAALLFFGPPWTMDLFVKNSRGQLEFDDRVPLLGDDLAPPFERALSVLRSRRLYPESAATETSPGSPTWSSSGPTGESSIGHTSAGTSKPTSGSAKSECGSSKRSVSSGTAASSKTSDTRSSPSNNGENDAQEAHEEEGNSTSRAPGQYEEEAEEGDREVLIDTERGVRQMFCGGRARR